MARTERNMRCQPDDVFRVLLDARRYPDWVVGARTIRGVDSEWPAVGSAFYHRVGVLGEVKDKSEILELDPPRRIVLRTYLRPLGIARVIITAEPSLDGTRVAIVEEPERGTRLRRIRRLLDPLMHLRNREALRRLERAVGDELGEETAVPRRAV